MTATPPSVPLLDRFRAVLDAAYQEWAAQGWPPGEAVVHLHAFQEAGLWQPPPDPPRSPLPIRRDPP